VRNRVKAKKKWKKTARRGSFGHLPQGWKCNSKNWFGGNAIETTLFSWKQGGGKHRDKTPTCVRESLPRGVIESLFFKGGGLETQQ